MPHGRHRRAPKIDRPRRLRGLAALTATAAVATTALAAPASAGTAETAALSQATNAARAAYGEPTLVESAYLDRVAAAQADRMAAAALLFHTPDLPAVVTDWQVLGENVGVGPDVAHIERAFLASPEHRANILNPAYTQIGVATVDSGGRVWVAVEFRRPA